MGKKKAKKSELPRCYECDKPTAKWISEEGYDVCPACAKAAGWPKKYWK